MAGADRPAGPKHAFAHVGLGAQVVFYTAVFLIFAPLSLVYDLASPKGLPWPTLLFWFAYSGLTAVGWAYAFTRDLRALYVLLPFSVAVPIFFGGNEFYPRQGVKVALLLEAAAAGGAIILGYILFVVFISGEGSRTVRLLTEVRLAKEIHDHLVPAVVRTAGPLEVYGVSSPASEVGGDLMDVYETSGRAGLYVADVTGHGVPAGVSMSMVKSAICMKLRDRPALADLLGGLNEMVTATQRPGTLVTFAGLEIDAGGRATYALAGHLPILHYRPSTQALARLWNQQPPLGLLEGWGFTSAEVDSAPGDLFVILTDGLTEVFDRQGEQFGDARLERLVAEHAGRPLSDIHAAVLAAVREFGPQTDDQTLILARVVPAASSTE